MKPKADVRAKPLVKPTQPLRVAGGASSPLSPESVTYGADNGQTCECWPGSPGERRYEA